MVSPTSCQTKLTALMFLRELTSLYLAGSARRIFNEIIDISYATKSKSVRSSESYQRSALLS